MSVVSSPASSPRIARSRRPVAAVTALLFALHALPLHAAVFGAVASAQPARSVLPDLGDAESDTMSPSTERKLGDEIMRQAHEAGDVLEDPEAAEFLGQFGANLVAHATPGERLHDFQFFVVDDRAINAFAVPGGYIGINSGLMVAVQTESELASVMAHEMGHVIQRHIARGIARERQTNLVALAATLLGILAASRSHSIDAGAAAIAGGQGYAIQDQLDFSRAAEREADRVGFQILQEANYDVNGMTSFFGRLQQATRIDETAAPGFLLTHPLTSERIADIQNRVRETPYRQRADSLDFHLVRARMRVLQDTTVQGLRDTRTAFEEQLRLRAHASETAAHYGLAFVLLKQGDARGAQRELDIVQKRVGTPDAIVLNLMIDVKQASGDATAAIALASDARRQYPQSRMLAQNYADTLQQAGRHDEAIAFLQDQRRFYRNEPVLCELLAKSYAAKGDAMTSHRLLGEGYLMRGSIRAALQQMQIARRSAPREADFYEVSQIDVRVRELTVRAEELRKAEKEAGTRSTPTLTFTTSSDRDVPAGSASDPRRWPGSAPRIQVDPQRQ